MPNGVLKRWATECACYDCYDNLTLLLKSRGNNLALFNMHLYTAAALLNLFEQTREVGKVISCERTV